MEEKNFRSITPQEVIDANRRLQTAVKEFQEVCDKFMHKYAVDSDNIPDNTVEKCQLLLFLDVFGDLKKSVSMIDDVIGDTEKVQDFFNTLFKECDTTPKELERNLMMKQLCDVADMFKTMMGL